ncbi:CAZyme family CE10 [Penicillium canescens]|nr:CAZyme family CE10 [Penicillium canescens]
MAPEHPFPAALNDAEDAVNSVIARPEEYNLTRLSIPGFTADANLALAASANFQPISRRHVPVLDLILPDD